MKKKLLAILAIVIAAIAIPSALFAWGPNRPTYTIEHPAEIVTFNSITNNPSHGDERNFVQVREATASNTTYVDSISLTAGKEYVVYMYFHNNAAANLNLNATGSYAKFELPAKVENGSNGTKAVGYVGANNATPKEVWDDISFSNKTGGDMLLSFVAGSATIHSFGAVNGKIMSDTIVTTGAPIGYNALDGVVPGCNEFAGYVTFRVKADQPNFTVSKQVHKTGATGWKETESVNPGDSVDFLITYTNTGTMTQNDVSIYDVLPKGLTYVKDSTYVANTNHPSGSKVADGITTNGINIGDYAANSNAFIKFSAIVDKNSDLEKCGLNTLTNTARVQTENGIKTDTATVTVNKTCETPKVVYTCNKLNASKIGDKAYKFTTSYTLENATLSNITYVVKNSKGEVIKTETGSDTFSYTIGDDTKYSIQATVNAVADGKTVSTTSEGCVATIATELPQTGVGETALTLFGLGSLVTSAGYYISSRRALLGR